MDDAISISDSKTNGFMSPIEDSNHNHNQNDLNINITKKHVDFIGKSSCSILNMHPGSYQTLMSQGKSMSQPHLKLTETHAFSKNGRSQK